MRWSAALGALLTDLLADTELTTALGGAHIYRDGEHAAPQSRAVYFSVIRSGPEENVQGVLTQWDVFAPDIDTALAIENRLHAKLDWVGWKDVGGVWLSSVWEESRDHPEPDFDVIHRSLDFRHEPALER